MLCYINGQFLPQSEARIHVSDLGLLRGYGIFDFFRCIGKQPMFLEEHLDRFYSSAQHMELEVGLTRGDLKEVIFNLLEVNNMPSSGIRLLLSGGESSDGYAKEGATLIITQESIPIFNGIADEMGVKLCLYEYQRMLPEIKTTNYVVGILKNSWFKKQGANDLLFHMNGWISELPRSNFFMVDQNGVLCTPNSNVLQGITRMQIIKHASTFMQVSQRPIHTDELLSASEAFLTGTGKRIIPIGQIDEININKGKPGPVAKKLLEYFYSLEDELVGN